MERSSAFDTFRFSHRDLELRNDGILVPLQRQPAMVLGYLLDNAGRVVCQEELARHIWPAGHHVEVDQGLRFCIRQVRRALGDVADAPRYIETLPRKGYRWCHGPRWPAEAGWAPTAAPKGRSLTAAARSILVAAATLCLGIWLGGLQAPREPLPGRIQESGGWVSREAPELIRALHVLSHAVLEPGLEREAERARDTLWAITLRTFGLEPHE
jgi:DNA-binding winged helix-turn-helix (wHTH) protein